MKWLREQQTLHNSSRKWWQDREPGNHLVPQVPSEQVCQGLCPWEDTVSSGLQLRPATGSAGPGIASIWPLQPRPGLTTNIQVKVLYFQVWKKGLFYGLHKCPQRLGSRVILLEGGGTLEVGHSGRSLGHWECVFEWHCGTLDSSLLYFASWWWGEQFPAIYAHCYCHLTPLPEGQSNL
jgi:hypothetical protein